MTSDDPAARLRNAIREAGLSNNRPSGSESIRHRIVARPKARDGGEAKLLWHGLGHDADPETIEIVRPANELGIPIRPGLSQEWGNYVYASSSRDVALAFSLLARRRSICLIDPGDLVAEVDPDFPTRGVRFPGAVSIVEVLTFPEHACPSARQVVECIAADMLWSDPTPRYDAAGYLRASPEFLSAGYSDGDFRWLGPWFPSEHMHLAKDGAIAVLDDNANMHMMYPPGHPMTIGKRRTPRGTLEKAWTTAGGVVAAKEHFMVAAVAAKWADDGGASRVRQPWDW